MRLARGEREPRENERTAVESARAQRTRTDRTDPRLHGVKDYLSEGATLSRRGDFEVSLSLLLSLSLRRKIRPSASSRPIAATVEVEKREARVFRRLVSHARSPASIRGCLSTTAFRSGDSRLAQIRPYRTCPPPPPPPSPRINRREPPGRLLSLVSDEPGFPRRFARANEP